jgi:hypothetical protein
VTAVRDKKARHSVVRLNQHVTAKVDASHIQSLLPSASRIPHPPTLRGTLEPRQKRPRLGGAFHYWFRKGRAGR